MRNLMFKSLIMGMTIAFAGATAAQADTVTQLSSSVFSASQNHYDLVLFYSPKASVPLTVNNILVGGVTGDGVSQTLNSCGTPVKQGDTVVAHTINPGGFCFLRAFPTGNAVFGQVVLSDSTPDTTNINNNVRTSLEVRDASDNTLIHAEAH